MIKKLLVAVLSLFAAMAFAAVDANKATQAELEAVKGVGPAIATKILDERKKSPFKDWPDMVDRVKGIGDGNAAKFSADGLTVNGATFKGAAPAAMAKKEDKPAAKVEEKKAAPAVAAAPAPAPAPAPAAAVKATVTTPAAAPAPVAVKVDDKKAAAMKEADDKKAAKAAAADAKKKAKEDKKAAKAAKAADAKASDAKK